MFKKLLSIGALAVFYLNVNAQEVVSQDLQEITVTANKLPQKTTQTGKVMTIIPDSVIARNSGATLTELLSRQVGIFVAGSHQVQGSNQELYLRGASYGNTLILIDGVPAYDPSAISGNFDLNLIPLTQIERIEILKGSQSTVYGSDAMAGVINIITHKNKNQTKLRFNSNLSGGSYGTVRGNAGISGNIKDYNYSVIYNKQVSKGFSAAAINPLLSSIQNFDKDGFNEDFLRAEIGRKNDRLSSKIYTQIAGYKNDIDAGAFADEKDYIARNNNFQIGGSEILNLKKASLNFNYNFSSINRSYIDDSTSIEKGAFSKYQKGTYKSDAMFVEFYTNLFINKNVDALLGVDFRSTDTDQTYRSVSSFGLYESEPIDSKVAKVNQISAFASVILKELNGFNFEIGSRLNRHSVYGTNITYSLNPSYNIRDKVKLFVNASSGYKVPGLYQLFSIYGNQNLQPEKSQNLEGGLQLNQNKTNYIRAVYFNRTIEDIIIFKSLNKEPYGIYENFDIQKDSGFELDGVVGFSNFNLTANYTRLNGFLETKKEVYNLFRRPKNSGNINLSFQKNKFSTNLNLRLVGERTDRFYDAASFSTKETKLNSYNLLDYYADYKISKSLKVFVDLRNILNQSYQEIYGYNTRGFNLMGGIQINL
jgi:vitamin B12 transporter